MPRSRIIAAFLLPALLLLAAPVATSQAQDDALDKLLQKLEEKPKPANDPGAGQGTPAPGQIAPDDQGLDNLLKKLGETPDQPTPDQKPAMPGLPGLPGPDTPPPSGGDQSTDPLKEKDKNLDEHLEGMLRVKKSKDDQQQQQQQQGEDTGPLTEAIKKMQEAERRLGDNDTGEQTRKTQGDVVKELDQILEQLRQTRSQSKSQQKTKEIQQAGQKPGNQPGQKPGENPGNDGKGTGAQAPQKPSVGEVLAGQKDTWGDLPPHLREEMENVFREEMLPAKRDLIIRYYSSVARKGRAGGDR